MGLFDRQIQFINEVEQAVEEEFRNAVDRFGFVMKDFIVNKQLFREGIDGQGERLPGYKRTTIRLKIAKGDPVDRTTLRDDGDFYASIQIDAFDDRFEVTSDVPYDKYILKRYGRDVLKLTEENIQEFVETYFVPNYKNYVNNKITE